MGEGAFNKLQCSNCLSRGTQCTGATTTSLASTIRKLKCVFMSFNNAFYGDFQGDDACTNKGLVSTQLKYVFHKALRGQQLGTYICREILSAGWRGRRVASKIGCRGATAAKSCIRNQATLFKLALDWGGITVRGLDKLRKIVLAGFIPDQFYITEAGKWMNKMAETILPIYSTPLDEPSQAPSQCFTQIPGGYNISLVRLMQVTIPPPLLVT